MTVVRPGVTGSKECPLGDNQPIRRLHCVLAANQTGPALAGQRSTDNLHPNEIRQRIPGAGHAGPGSNIRSEGYELAFKMDWDL